MAFRASDQGLSYQDAVRLLGQDESKIIKFLDRLTGAAVISASAGSLGALAFFDVRDEFVKWGNDVVRTIRDRVTGLSRCDRTQRLVAAHAVIVITSFYEALGEVLDGRGNSLTIKDLELTPEEQEAIVSSATSKPAEEAKFGSLVPQYRAMVEWLLDVSRAMPEPQAPYERTLKQLKKHYGIASSQLAIFISQLACWEALSETDRDRMIRRLNSLPAAATRRYEESYRRLAEAAPEFAVWTNLTDHRATRTTVERIGGEIHDRLDSLTTGLAGVVELMQQISGRAAPDLARSELLIRYRRGIEVSILSGADAPEGVLLPSLRAAYVNPRCRVSDGDKDARLADENWWANVGVICDVQPVIIGLLTMPRATTAPLLVLGHPGAGKSLLTKMLAARLVGTDLLPVRVELRSVYADASIQAQIEHAIEDLTGRDISWPDLVASGDGALPVVMLDGFDELLQATGANRSDYLEQVAEFQRRERELGRPVAVIVTSRTVVADRARIPPHSVVLKLEPFSEAEVATWLKVWNGTNAATFGTRGIRPLPVAAALAHRELASQPLLLMMLALYDAGDNALQNAKGDLSRAELYERLLADFARREVRKHHPDLDDGDERRRIETEFRQLAVVALAMFNRHAQVVAENEFNRDFDILLPRPAGTALAGLGKPLDATQRVVGRFFFVHESRALRDGGKEHAFEFLHATFGEFLVGRIVVNTLRELVEVRALNERHATPSRLDDGFLSAALSFAALAGSGAIVEFTAGLLHRLPSDERAAVRDLVSHLLRDAPYAQPTRSLGDYEPVRRSVSARHAAFSCNLALLAVLSADGPIEASDWNTSLWWSELRFNEWDGLRESVRIYQRLDLVNRQKELWAKREDGSPVRPYEDVWPMFSVRWKHGQYRHFSEAEFPAHSEIGRRLRTAAFFSNVMSAPWGQNLILLPYYRHVQDADATFQAEEATALLELRLAPIEAHGPRLRMELYRQCLRRPRKSTLRGILLRQLREDARHLDLSDVIELLLDLDLPVRPGELSVSLEILEAIESPNSIESPRLIERFLEVARTGPQSEWDNLWARIRSLVEKFNGSDSGRG